MTQYNTLNVKLSNSQINKLKSGIKNGTDIKLILHQMLLVILMMRIIFYINCRDFIKILQMISQLI